MASTQSAQAKDSEKVLDSAIADIYDGVADVFTAPGSDAKPIEFEKFDEPFKNLEDGKVLLTNIYYADEDVYIPTPDRKGWSGKKASFVGHRLVTDEATAQVVKAACPYVYQEDPGGHWLTHKASGFSTTNAQAWETYIERWTANQ